MKCLLFWTSLKNTAFHNCFRLFSSNFQIIPAPSLHSDQDLAFNLTRKLHQEVENFHKLLSPHLPSHPSSLSIYSFFPPKGEMTTPCSQLRPLLHLDTCSYPTSWPPQAYSPASADFPTTGSFLSAYKKCWFLFYVRKKCLCNPIPPQPLPFFFLFFSRTHWLYVLSPDLSHFLLNPFQSGFALIAITVPFKAINDFHGAVVSDGFSVFVLGPATASDTLNCSHLWDVFLHWHGRQQTLSFFSEFSGTQLFSLISLFPLHLLNLQMLECPGLSPWVLL